MLLKRAICQESHTEFAHVAEGGAQQLGTYFVLAAIGRNQEHGWRDSVELLRLAALVHDIAKIGVRDDVLLKEASLSPQERAAVELHPVIAADILRPIHNSAEIAEIVLQHHEAPDGSGYPRGLSKHEIMPEANILRVADMFTALTEPRPYKQAMSSAEALRFMRPLSGVKIDGPAFDALQAELTDSVDTKPTSTSDAVGP